MPRQSRIDAPGALHHIMARGIEGRRIFKNNRDRNDFLSRLGKILKETGTQCYAWVLLGNHFHLLLRTGLRSIATVMRRLLTGYAVSFNRRHDRCGHLFQNRYKSILCQEDTYLLELVRYIHLNPIRANIVKDINELDVYPFCGHHVIMGKAENDWHDTEWVLKLFDDRLVVARREYRAFVNRGVSQGRRDDLTGGGLIRSSGGWAAVKAMRESGAFEKSDERILGDGAFVEAVLSAAHEKMEQRYALSAEGYDLKKIAKRVSDLMEIEPSEIWARGKQRKRVNARSLLCYWAAREVGISMAELSRALNLSLTGVSVSVRRGERIAREKGYTLRDLKV